MTRSLCMIAAVALVIVVTPFASVPATDFADLTQGQEIGAFSTEAVYLNESGKRVGARFRHIPSDFVLDVLRIQSVPQAFMWVNTPPPSDQGEPHTLEHLLLGKGTRGRYVASLEDMSLGSSSAFTRQLWTCYHFHTAAGEDVFFNLMKEKLNAMLHPNYSDEEIRREVANMGVSFEAADSSYRLEEKGTVYAEMSSSFERPWYHIGHTMGQLIYGPGHPCSYSSGGLPSAIRTMVPENIRQFHDSTHHLNNMGMVMSVADDISLDTCLIRVGGIFDAVEPGAKRDKDPAAAVERLPAPKGAPEGTIEVVGFPAQVAATPGIMMLGWPAQYRMDLLNRVLFEIFLENLASGNSSNLYQRFIDSQRRRMDLGSNNIYQWIDEGNGSPFYIAFTSVKPEMLTDSACAQARTIILEEIQHIADLSDASADLAAFNERALSNLAGYRRGLRDFLNTPPRFGYRGTGSSWMDHLALLQIKDGFKRQITLDDELNKIEEMLKADANIWKDYLTEWKLLSTSPYVVAAKADPELYQQNQKAYQQRLADYETKLEQEYNTDDRTVALAAFKADYDRKTAEIDSAAATIEMPKFIPNPPLTLDDQLKYTVTDLPGGGPLVTSTFDNMTGATFGIAINLRVIPESLLVYVPSLPALMTDVGVVRDGHVIPYDELSTVLQREIRSLRAYFSSNNRTERAELVLRASGTSPEENSKAIGWLETTLFNSDWREENLPRMRDAVDLELKNSRNRMQSSEESWVDDPAYAYWKQHSPVLLAAGSFLTQTHFLQRTKWLLSGDDNPEVVAQFVAGMAKLASMADGNSRDDLEKLLAALASDTAAAAQTLPSELTSDDVARYSRSAALDLKASLGDIPDENLTADWQYLCGEIASDFAVPPREALAQIAYVTSLLRHQDNVRGFLIASTESQAKIKPRLESLVAQLDGKTSRYQAYSNNNHIVDRMRDRYPDLPARPAYVGLVNQNSSSGVFLNTADCADYANHDPHALAAFLSARLYGGGGAHSMFMKTWGAGLAYSNGLRSSVALGRIIYYAERCPDLSQTMQFVVGELEKAPYDPSLAQYAVAQAFDENRAASRYEQRGEAMAADLADGVTPKVVTSFRKGILNLRSVAGFYDTLQNLMKPTYGQVLPGYGPEIRSIPNAISFVIGPETQLDSYQDYLTRLEADDVRLYHLYPRDYWIVRENM